MGRLVAGLFYLRTRVDHHGR